MPARNSSFTSNTDAGRIKLERLSHMAFMLYLKYATDQRRKTWDNASYEIIREALYKKRDEDILKYRKWYQKKYSRLFPEGVDKKNPEHMKVNYIYYLIKQEYKSVYNSTMDKCIMNHK